jgi:hypothetical protein
LKNTWIERTKFCGIVESEVLLRRVVEMKRVSDMEKGSIFSECYSMSDYNSRTTNSFVLGLIKKFCADKFVSKKEDP